MRHLSLLLLLLLLVGCGGAARPVEETSAPPVEATAPPLTEAPPETPTTEAALGPVTAGIEENGIRFAFDPSIATGITIANIPAAPPTDIGMVPQAIYPAHRQVTFQGYAVPSPYQSPQLFIYPVEEFVAMSPEAAETVAQLEQLLAEKPAAPPRVPALPLPSAEQVVRAQVSYMEFQNGQGVRLLTQYEIAPYPITKDRLIYTFQGLTNDGTYYVGAILPVSGSFLPDSYDPAQPAPVEGFPTLSMNGEGFDEALNTYYGSITQRLNDAPGSDFTPELTLLDALIQSLEIAPPSEATP